MARTDRKGGLTYIWRGLEKLSSLTALGRTLDEPSLTDQERRWRREARSAWLRLAALFILIVNLMVGEHDTSLAVHANVTTSYALATFLALALALVRRGPAWTATAFVVIDAALIIALFHEHLFGPTGTLNHALTAPTLAIGFLLLTHVSLRLKPGLVLLFSTLVISGWLSLLAATVLYHSWEGTHDAHSRVDFLTEGALAATFAFAAFVGYLLTRDHNVLLKGAVTSETRRQNLARFFSPDVVTELQTKGASLGLERREAAVMFVDLRGFTKLSETIQPEEIAELLAEYRELVTQEVFTRKGTIDKFIGDGVMAVFGHPRTAPDDASRALHCALQLTESLPRWKAGRLKIRKPALDAGIGLHVGSVIGGVLQSGSHDEFTVLGDAVNIAERLEGLSKALGAILVVSDALIAAVPSSEESAPWIWKEATELDGRSGRLRIAYLPRIVESKPEPEMRLA
jgi:adenylate cyclase